MSILGIAFTLIIIIVLVNFWMKIANYIGEKLRIGIFFNKLIKKIWGHK